MSSTSVAMIQTFPTASILNETELFRVLSLRPSDPPILLTQPGSIRTLTQSCFHEKHEMWASRCHWGRSAGGRLTIRSAHKHNLNGSKTVTFSLCKQLGRGSYAAVTAKISARLASVNVLKHTLISTLKMPTTQSFVFSDSRCMRTSIDAIGSIDAKIHVIQDVILSTVES